MLGDAYGAAVVEALSKKELEAMDLEMKKQLERERSDLESAQTDLKSAKKVLLTLPYLSKYFEENSFQDEEEIQENGSNCGSSNGSSVEVPEVIVVDKTEKK